MQLVRVAAHGGVVLLDEEPAHLILANLVLLLLGRGSGGRSRGLDGLEVGRVVHGSVSVIEGIGVPVRVRAVDGSLSHVGHVEMRGFVFGVTGRFEEIEGDQEMRRIVGKTEHVKDLKVPLCPLAAAMTR